MIASTAARTSPRHSHTSPPSTARTATRGALVALASVVAAWAVLLGLIGRHRVFVSGDSLSNYAHVWWIADGLRHGHTLRMHMPVLGHGRALTYPYAFLPWTAAGVAWLLVGERAVTLTLVVGCASLGASMLWALPELLDDAWIAAAALASPVLVAVAVIGQLPFAWAAAGLFLAAGWWRRRRVVPAIVAAALAQATHPAVVLPIAAVVVAAALARRWDPRLARAYLASVVLALPAAWLVVASPVFSDSSTGTKAFAFLTTVGVRALVVVVPLALVWLRRRAGRAVGPVALAIALLLNVLLAGLLGTRVGWHGLRRTPDTAMLAFVGSPAFVPGRTYRLLRAADGKVGMYQLVVHGARLDSELFPESIDRRSFRDASAYAQFLRARHVDAVLAYANYDATYRTNEHALLERLASPLPCAATGITVTRFHHERAWDGYRVVRGCR